MPSTPVTSGQQPDAAPSEPRTATDSRACAYEALDSGGGSSQERFSPGRSPEPSDRHLQGTSPESLAGCGPDAQVIGCRTPGSFAHGVLRDRHPALITQVRETFCYGPRQRARLDALLAEITNGVVEPCPTTPTTARGGTPGAGVVRPVVVRAPFLWAESYFYRRLLRPWTTPRAPGSIDPFEPAKTAELTETFLDSDLAR